MKKKVCKKCKMFVEGEVCPNCGGTEFVSNWKGRVYVVDAEKSEVAKKAGCNKNGEYAIKIS